MDITVYTNVIDPEYHKKLRDIIIGALEDEGESVYVFTVDTDAH